MIFFEQSKSFATLYRSTLMKVKDLADSQKPMLQCIAEVTAKKRKYINYTMYGVIFEQEMV